MAREAGRSSSKDICDGEEPGNGHRAANTRSAIAFRDAETVPDGG